MNEKPVKFSKSERSEEKNARNDDSLDELRRMILEPLTIELTKLQGRLDNPHLRATEISHVLAESILIRSSHDKQIAKALEPSVEEALKNSIRKDPKSIVDILFPLIGPFVRRIISSTLYSMIQSLNQILSNSFSLKGLKWRIEALRTKKSFAEVVLIHSIIYRIEQVFLIHRDSGMMLQHVVARDVKIKDPDLVSGMLTAIQDFMRDSFDVEKDEGLETLKVGDYSIWIETGPYAVLAAVIRGQPPEDLKMLLKQSIESIHFTHGSEMESFSGNLTSFETTQNRLKDCLQSQYIQKEQKISPLIWIILGVCGLVILLWLIFAYRAHWRWKNYISGLYETPGIVITNIKRDSGRHLVFGFRDPFSPDPAKLLEEQKLNADIVSFHLQPYNSLHPAFLFKRINHLLNPPEGILLTLKGDVLSASGSASHEWIINTRKIAKALYGISQYYDNNVTDNDKKEIYQIKERVEKQILLFNVNESTLLSGQDKIIEELYNDFRRLFSLKEILGVGLQVNIIGHTDSSGTERRNLLLSKRRSELVKSILVEKGINLCYFFIEGVGSKEPLRQENTEKDMKLNRNVTFKVILTDISY